MSKQELFNKTLEAKRSMQLALDHIQATKYKDGEYERGMRNAFADCVRWIDELYSETDEPEITDKQAWNKIAEAYPESVHNLRNTLDNAVFSHKDEPKKVVVPQDVADFIEDGNRYDKIAFLVHQKYLGVNSLMRECLVKDWLRSVDYKTVLSLVNGYEVEKEQLWTVQINEKYLAGMQIYNESETENIDNKEAYHITTVSRLQNAKKFNMLAKAEAVALIAGGVAVKVED